MLITKRYEMMCLRQGHELEAKGDPVIVEHTLNIHVDGVPYAVVTCTPEHLDDMVLGRLLSDGLIRKTADVKDIVMDEACETAHVTLAGERNKGDDSPIPTGHMFPADMLVRAVQSFLHDGELYKATGATHACALWEDEGTEAMCYREDIGRKNAMDKTLGAALGAGVDYSRTIMLLSGRVPLDVANKALRARIPVLISRSALTAAAIDLAREKNMTIVGFARGTRINIYAGMDRIAGLIRN